MSSVSLDDYTASEKFDLLCPRPANHTQYKMTHHPLLDQADQRKYLDSDIE